MGNTVLQRLHCRPQARHGLFPWDNRLKWSQFFGPSTDIDWQSLHSWIFLLRPRKCHWIWNWILRCDDINWREETKWWKTQTVQPHYLLYSGSSAWALTSQVCLLLPEKNDRYYVGTPWWSNPGHCMSILQAIAGLHNSAYYVKYVLFFEQVGTALTAFERNFGIDEYY